MSEVRMISTLSRGGALLTIHTAATLITTSVTTSLASSGVEASLAQPRTIPLARRAFSSPGAVAVQQRQRRHDQSPEKEDTALHRARLSERDAEAVRIWSTRPARPRAMFVGPFVVRNVANALAVSTSSDA